MERPEPTVRVPRVVVPRPPLLTASGLVRVREVKLGVAETAIVEVPDMTMLEPAVRRFAMLTKVGAALPLAWRIWKGVPEEVKAKALPVP